MVMVLGNVVDKDIFDPILQIHSILWRIVNALYASYIGRTSENAKASFLLSKCYISWLQRRGCCLSRYGEYWFPKIRSPATYPCKNR